VNADTVTLIERPYQEIVDDILTAIVGGVVNEPIFFDVKEDLYPLSQPAQDVRSITGTLQQRHHAFRKEVDFVFSEGDNAIVWQPGSAHPDDETIFYVDYFRRDSRSPLSDINVGSVTRTLSEAIGREIATVYQQINQAYLSGFVDTASGQSLDLVVAILGVVRKTKDFAVGLATFFRDPAAAEGNITIPEGTILSTAKGEATFVTTQMRTLQRGQVRIDVPVRASDASKGDVGVVKAGAITTLAQPISGIARVTNFEATVLGKEDETDEELRARAKAVLRGLGKATLAALARVIFEGRGKLAEVWDPNSPPVKRSDPGTVVLLVESEPERFPSLRAGVEETRAAGVLTTLVARYVFFKPRVVARIASGLPAAGKVKLIGQIIAKMQEYVDTLSAGDPAKGQDLLKAIGSVTEVSEAMIVDVMAWRADIGQPGAEMLVDALLIAIASTPSGDDAALRTALSRVVTEAVPPVPTGRRIPDRGLVQDVSGQRRATDEEIEAGQFQVAATVGGEPWWVVLDVEPADIVLVES
jgi:Baseplate J-like protein